MPLQYKMNVLQSLKEKGYTPGVLRNEKLLAESTIQKLRESNSISWSNIERLCKLLECQPGDIMEYVEE